MKARSLRIGDAEYSAQVECSGGPGNWSSWASAQLEEARRKHQSKARRKAGNYVLRKSESSARGLAECLHCRRLPWRLTREMSDRGRLVFVVYCCEGIELEGAATFEQAVEIWNNGDKKKKESKNHDKA